jgi:protein TonB
MYEEERKLYESLSPQYEAAGKKNHPTWKATEIASGVSPDAPQPKKIRVSQGVLKERAIRKVAPTYPSEARAAGVAGTVKVDIVISEEGVVIEATAFDGPEQLREAAIEAARQWTFKPETLEGKPARMLGVLSFIFTLRQ